MKKSRIARYDSRNHKSRTDWSRIGHQTDERIAAAVKAIYGRRLEDLSAEWQYWMRQRYYPAVTASSPLSLDARLVSRLAIKPAAYRLPGDTATQLLYFSPSGGSSPLSPCRGLPSRS